MSIFRFQVHDGHHTVAPETVELPDLAAARRESVRRTGATLVLDAHTFLPSGDWHLDVTDEAGTLLFRLDVAMTVAPAAKRGP